MRSRPGSSKVLGLGRCSADMGNVSQKEMRRIMNERKESKGSKLTRRRFVQRLGQILASGGFVHFFFPNITTYGMMRPQTPDICPGGMPTEDLCISPANPDMCPGEKDHADECPADGKPPEDVCNSGLKSADTCIPATEKSERSDQCQTGMTVDDSCPNYKPSLKSDGGDDVCPSGRSDTDECETTGTDADGDQCPGGGLAEDTCVPEDSGNASGDDCSEGSYGMEDDCKEESLDNCSAIFPVDDDSCPNGRNVSKGVNGGDDWCEGTIIASDECYTGEDEDDLCDGRGGNGQSDACPSIADSAELDVCNERSDDYCTTGIAATDECASGMSNEDECVGGVSTEDVCYKHIAESDECISQITGSDQGGCKVIGRDGCISFIEDSCMLNPDNDKVE